jgi:DNA ligase D-like protein (predicted 3'-phosphoesterase)
MAIHVEDHPIDYASFEGEIPAGEYGGGKVETWDRGTWEPLADPDEGMRKGYEPVLKKTRWCVVKRETKLTRQPSPLTTIDPALLIEIDPLTYFLLTLSR